MRFGTRPKADRCLSYGSCARAVAASSRSKTGGRGIGREHLARLTERFYRADESRSRQSGGTGLGLAIVKHVVQRHGGELEITSEPGRGSTFRLLLPSSRVRVQV
jgi:two-component system, OmpR family, phosphate regulon sensor histidine kinase PhoR